MDRQSSVRLPGNGFFHCKKKPGGRVYIHSVAITVPEAAGFDCDVCVRCDLKRAGEVHPHACAVDTIPEDPARRLGIQVTYKNVRDGSEKSSRCFLGGYSPLLLSPYSFTASPYGTFINIHYPTVSKRTLKLAFLNYSSIIPIYLPIHSRQTNPQGKEKKREKRQSHLHLPLAHKTPVLPPFPPGHTQKILIHTSKSIKPSIRRAQRRSRHTRLPYSYPLPECRLAVSGFQLTKAGTIRHG